MTLDPVFGLLIAIPIVVLSVAAAFLVRPSRPAAALIAALAVCGFVAGCSGPAKTSSTTSAQGAVASAAPLVPLTAPQIAAAQRAKVGGGVSVDVFDVRPDGAQNPAGVTLSGGDTLFVLGWAYDEGAHAPCAAVGLLVDAKRVFPASYGAPRTDVAAFYKDTARTNVGLMIRVPAREIGAGAHATRVVCVGSAGAATENATTRTVTVR